MNVPKYQVGDLIIIKPELWIDKKERTGIITELLFHSTFDPEKCSFLVRFEDVHPIIRNRIIWHNDVTQHFPVIK